MLLSALKLRQRVPVAAIWKLLRASSTTRRERSLFKICTQCLKSAREDPQPPVVELGLVSFTDGSECFGVSCV